MALKAAMKIFDKHDGNYVEFTKRDNLRVYNDKVYYNNTLMAVFYEPYMAHNRYLIVTLQDYKSQKNWNKTKKDLIQIGIKQGYRIIFVPELDIGFGVNNTVSAIDPYKTMISLLKLYPFNHFKDSKQNVLTVITNINKTICFTYDQYDSYDDNILSAEYIMSEFINDSRIEEINISHIDMTTYGLTDEYNSYEFISLFEQNETTLQSLLDVGAIRIYFGIENKNDSDEYIQLTNDIWNKTIRHNELNVPVIYKKIINTYFNKYKEKHYEQIKN